MSIKVEVFSSPGCGKCGKAKEVLRKQVDEIGENQIEWREVNILDEMDKWNTFVKMMPHLSNARIEYIIQNSFKDIDKLLE